MKTKAKPTERSEQLSEIERSMRRHVERLLAGVASLHMSVERTDGSEVLTFSWQCNGWRGALTLTRQYETELKGKQLAGILAYLQTTEGEPS